MDNVGKEYDCTMMVKKYQAVAMGTQSKRYR